MGIRHQRNSNLVLIEGQDCWEGLPVQTKCGPLAIPYLKRMRETILAAVGEYPRTLAIRFDVRFPKDYKGSYTAVISRFIESLKAILKADEIRRAREGKRVHPCRLRYFWVKEWSKSHHWHYHVCIFLNADAYFTLGLFKKGSDEANGDTEGSRNMADRIKQALSSALGLSKEESKGLVHFPMNPTYRINKRCSCWEEEFAELFHRVSYFAKADTKRYGDNSKHFSCSRG